MTIDTFTETRRELLGRSLSAAGTAALASLLGRDSCAFGASDDTALGASHFAPRARSVILLKMAGAPSQLDLLDHKPQLQRFDGKPCPEEFVKDQEFAFIVGRPPLLASPFRFSRHGDSGAEISELLPHTARVADELCIIKSMQTDQFNHAPALLFLQTGAARPGHPSMGAWLSYGLGSPNRDLPAFVVMSSGGVFTGQNKQLWGSGFLPSVHQGVLLRSQGDPVPYLSHPAGISRDQQKWSVETINALNQLHEQSVANPEILTRIRQYAMAYRMQVSVPDLTRIDDEPASIHQMYGTRIGKRSFSNNCLLARRLVERGVRFVQLYHGSWDTHGSSRGESLQHALRSLCRATDRSCAALITDLKQRGLLDETLVVWAGEFGRTPMYENRQGLDDQQNQLLGRDHHQHAFTVWMAGGGVKAGVTYGETDDLGFWVTRNPVHVHDLQATILHLLGIDHTRLVFRHQGRDFRLTDVGGTIVHKIIV